MTDPIQFRWPRCRKGYGFVPVPKEFFEKADYGAVSEWLPEWASPEVVPEIASIGAATGERQFIVPRGDVDRGDNETYQPLEEDSALYRNFAALDGSPDSICTFANRYGQLYQFEDWVVPTGWNGLKGRHGGNALIVTSVGRWRQEIATMAHAFEAYENKSYGELRTTFNLQNIAFLAQLTVGRDRGTIKPILRFSPYDLRDALWLQFGMAISGDAKLKKCVVCGRWFRIDVKGTRKTKVYCSSRCRVASHKNGKKAKLDRIPKPAGDAKGGEKKR